MGGSPSGPAFAPRPHQGLGYPAHRGCCRRAVLALRRRDASAPVPRRGALARPRSLGLAGRSGLAHALAMRDRSSEDGGAGAGSGGGSRGETPADDPLVAMKKWSRVLQQTGQEQIDDLKAKTVQALDNLFSGGFMQEGEAENDMLPVLRKFMMYDFEGYSPSRAQVPSSLLDDFENFGAPQALTAPSLGEGAASEDPGSSEASSAFQAGGASVAGWGRQQGVDRVDDGRLDLLQPLDRQQFSRAVQSGMSDMAVEDIDMVFDNIDKDGDGTLTLEELYETYKTVQAEVVTDQEIRDMSVRDFELSAAKLRPETPDAAFSNVLPITGDKGGEAETDASALAQHASAVDPPSDLSARMAEWEEVCKVLTTQSAYLPAEGQEMLRQAVELSAETLLARAADAGSLDLGDGLFGDGLALGGIVAGLQSQSGACWYPA